MVEADQHNEELSLDYNGRTTSRLEKIQGRRMKILIVIIATTAVLKYIWMFYETKKGSEP